MRVFRIFLCSLFLSVLCVVPAFAVDHEGCLCGGELILYIDVSTDTQGKTTGYFEQVCDGCSTVVASESYADVGASVDPFYYIFNGWYLMGGVSECNGDRFWFCEHFANMVGDLTWKNGEHFAYCSECDIYVPVHLLFSTPSVRVHSGDDCELCDILYTRFVNSGYSGEIVSPFAIRMTSVGKLVNASVGWVGDFVAVIIANPLLLMFVVVAFVGLGLGLIKRISRR